jgi:SAM-dependent methyltransferase
MIDHAVTIGFSQKVQMWREAAMTDITTAVGWNEAYATREDPFGAEPDEELQRVLKEGRIKPCRMLELGCGTGANSIFLATQGFDVTAVDISQVAVDKAQAKASQAGVSIRFLQADVLNLPDLGPTFALVFDRGLFHLAPMRVQRDRFRDVLASVTQPGGLYLSVQPNANESDPPGGVCRSRVRDYEFSLDLAPYFELVQLRECQLRFISRGVEILAWSALLRRKEKLALSQRWYTEPPQTEGKGALESAPPKRRRPRK